MTLGCVEEHEGDCTEKVPLPVPFKPGLGSQSASAFRDSGWTLGGCFSNLSFGRSKGSKRGSDKEIYSRKCCSAHVLLPILECRLLVDFCRICSEVLHI